MKKLLIILLVLCLASVANAYVMTDVRIVVTDGAGNVLPVPEQAGGHADPADSEITLMVGETIWLGVWNFNGNEPLPEFLLLTKWWGETEGYWTGNGNIYEPPCPPGSYIFWAAVWDGLSEPWLADLGKTAGGTGPMGIQCGLLFEAEWQCTAVGDVTMVVASVDFDGEYGYIYDQLIIHQIPEPTTLFLLGLGAVVLRRKRNL